MTPEQEVRMLQITKGLLDKCEQFIPATGDLSNGDLAGCGKRLWAGPYWRGELEALRELLKELEA